MNRHLCSASIVGVVLVLAAAFAGAQEPKGPKAPNFYPLQVGNNWQFRIETGGNTGKAASTIAAIETVDGVKLARVDFSVDGKVVASEHLSQTDKGIFRHMNDKVAIMPPLMLLQYPAKAGAKWKGNIASEKETITYYGETANETVAVPAGKFKSLRLTLKVEAEEKRKEEPKKGEKGEVRTILTTYWLVENVGIVKQTVKGENFLATIELEKFEPAKAK